VRLKYFLCSGGGRFVRHVTVSAANYASVPWLMLLVVCRCS